MKPIVSLALCAVLTILLAGCSHGKVLAYRSLNSQEQAWVHQQRIPLRLVVVPATALSYTNQWEARMVNRLATNLARTKLFSEVVIGDRFPGSNLRVVTRKSYGVLRCGTSLPITKVSLGLFRDNIAYSYGYDFDFVSPQTGETLTFTNLYRGVYRSGFWPARDDAFVGWLKFDLAQRRDEIESLLK